MRSPSDDGKREVLDRWAEMRGKSIDMRWLLVGALYTAWGVAWLVSS